jgi:cytochrome c-type biogenesis protein CcmI
MAFWITAAAMATMVALTIALGFQRGRVSDGVAGEARDDLQVYRDQLREVEKDVARGILSPTDAERLRTEISRRILDADRTRATAPVQAATPRAMRLAGMLLAPALVGLAFWIYAGVGAPGHPDMPLAQRLADAREARANRPAQEVAEAEMIARAAVEGRGLLRPPPSEEDRALVQRLRDALADRPEDLQGHRLLAVSEAALGNFHAAWAAQAVVVELLGDEAGADDLRALKELAGLRGGRAALAAERAALEGEEAPLSVWRDLIGRALALEDVATAHWAQGRLVAAMGDAATASDHVEHADLMIIAAGGYVSPEAEEALERALRMDPRHPLARYFIGLMFAQTERPDLTFQLWRQLLDEGPPDAPWIPPIRSQIEWMAMRAGVNYTLPPAGAAPARGPSLDEIEAAQDMDPEARAAMIEGMVASLAQRLASQGGSAEDWAQLIAAYGVLGRGDEAGAIWTEAQAVFGGRPEQLAVIRDAARRAGLVE